jgi:hypothetical protein
MTDRAQTFANHRRLHPVMHLVVTPVLIVYLVSAVVWAVQAPGYHAVIHAVMALALVLFSIASRQMATTAQDRIIRLEMRLRLAEVLPAELKPRIRELGVGQLVALRFAADAELPELTRRALVVELKNGEAIKREIKEWQADWLRV